MKITHKVIKEVLTEQVLSLYCRQFSSLHQLSFSQIQQWLKVYQNSDKESNKSILEKLLILCNQNRL